MRDDRTPEPSLEGGPAGGGSGESAQEHTYLLIVLQLVIQDDAIGLVGLGPRQGNAVHGAAHLVHDGHGRWSWKGGQRSGVRGGHERVQLLAQPPRCPDRDLWDHRGEGIWLRPHSQPGEPTGCRAAGAVLMGHLQITDTDNSSHPWGSSATSSQDRCIGPLLWFGSKWVGRNVNSFSLGAYSLLNQGTYRP